MLALKLKIHKSHQQTLQVMLCKFLYLLPALTGFAPRERDFCRQKGVFHQHVIQHQFSFSLYETIHKQKSVRKHHTYMSSSSIFVLRIYFRCQLISSTRIFTWRDNETADNGGGDALSASEI